jgi:ribosomal protein S18 acetylase RimI-like enzyme
MDLIFRKGLLSDIDRTFAVRGQTRENPLSKDDLARYGITPESIAVGVASKVIEGWVCLDDADVVGFCNGDNTTGEVLVLAVLPAYEGKGIGKRLLANVVQQLRASGFKTPWLAASPDARIRAYGFYRSLGWQPSGRCLKNGDQILELPGH